MTKDARILRKRTLYEGFNRAYEYELQMPSQREGEEYGAPTSREMLHTTDSVFVLVYAPKIDSFVLVREFRTGIFFNEGNDDPFLVSCIAGAIDKSRSPEETARAEVKEEAGLEAGALMHITTLYASPGRLTEKTHLYYTEVEGAPEEGLHGLEEEGEQIRSVVLKRDIVFRMMDDKKIIDAMTYSALSWFRNSKA